MLTEARTRTRETLTPWRSVPALADALNAGSKHPTFTIASLRNYLAKRDENGLDQYVRTVGRKVLVSEPGFQLWIAEHD